MLNKFLLNNIFNRLIEIFEPHKSLFFSSWAILDSMEWSKRAKKGRTERKSPEDNLHLFVNLNYSKLLEKLLKTSIF